MRSYSWILVLLAGLLAWSAVPSQANILIPKIMNYQGLLTNTSGVPINTTVSMVFSIYSASSGGSALWTEIQPSVTVTNGIYNVVLGSVTAIDIPFRTSYWLGVNVNGDGEMTPRHQLTNAAYSLASRKVVQQQVLTVALDGGDTCTVYGAIQILNASSPAPSQTNPWVIEVKAGVFNETSTLVIPVGTVVRGQGANATTIKFNNTGYIQLSNYSGLESLTEDYSGNATAVNFWASTSAYVRNCTIKWQNSNTTGIRMEGTTSCELSNNYVVGSAGIGGLCLLLASSGNNSTYALVKDNIFDALNMGSGNVVLQVNTSSGLSSNAVVSNNLFKFNGNTASATLGVLLYGTNSSNSRIVHNTFMGNTTDHAADIYNVSTFAYPVLGYSGPRGAYNVGSAGDELPAF